MGIPITDPPPSVLLKRLDIERDKIIKSKNLEIDKERYNMKEEARQLEKLLENPQYEPNLVEEIRSFEEIRLHNRRLAEILDIMVDRNNKGIELEKKEDIENAIKLYEQNVADEFFGTHPYDRLAIIYRKRKQFDDEIRIIKKAIEIIGDAKYKKRLEKAKILKEKYKERIR